MAADWPFLGRQREVDTLVAACRPGRRGVVVVGPAGVGKTSILAAARDRLQSRGRPTSIVLATFAASQLPFGVCPPGAFSAVEANAVCLVDDAHLLDRQTAALIRRRLADREITVALALRTGEPVPDDITAVWCDGVLTRLDVDRLGDDDLVASAEAFLAGPLDASAAERLTRLSAGNTLFFRLLVEGERASGRLIRRGDVWRWQSPGLPPALTELVTARLDELPATAREVLDLVALAGSLDLATLSGLISPAALERAESAGALAVDDAEDGRLIVRAAHPLFSEVTLARLPRLRARRLRAEIIAQLSLCDDAAAPATTLRRAVLMLDADLSRDPDLLTRGAELAVAAGDTMLADRLSGAALKAGGGFAAQSVRVFVRSWAGHEPDDTVRELSRLAQLAQTPTQAVRTVVNQALSLAWATDDADAARAVLNAALTRWPGFAALSAVAALIDVYRVAGKPTLAAEVLSDPGLDTTGTAITAAAAAASAAATGRHQDFHSAVQRCLTAAAEPADPAAFGVSVTPMMIRGYCLAGAIQQGRRFAEMRRAAALGREPFEHLLACMMADAALAAGAVRTARSLLDQAWAGLLPFGDAGPWRSICAGAASRTAALLGKPSEARVWYERAIAARRSSFALLDVDLLLTRAAVVAAEGAMAEASRVIMEAADLARDRGQHGYQVVALQQLLQLGMTGLSGRAAGLADLTDSPRGRAVRMLASALDDNDAVALHRSSADYEQLGDLIAAADVAALAATAFERAGLRPLAQRARVRVLRLSDAAEGARTTAMRRCLRALPLTPREWEIAELAAAGGSSRDIADRLVISVRTVEGHLYRIYGKLGLACRDDLAAVLGGTDE